MSTEQANVSQPLPPPPAVAPAPLPAAQPTPRVTYRRSPGGTVILSLLPGLGHLYLGLYQRGIGFFLTSMAAAWIGDRADIMPWPVFFMWGFAMIDAYRQAMAINTGELPQDLWATPVRKAPKRAGLGIGVFLTVLGLILLYDRFYEIDWYFLTYWWPMAFVLAGVYFIVSYIVSKQKTAAAENDPTTSTF